MEYRLFLRRPSMLSDRARIAILVIAFLILLISGSFSQAFAQSRIIAEIDGIEFATVRTNGFVLEQDGEITVDATCLDNRKTKPLSSNAWILDARTRRPVWNFSEADSRRQRGRNLADASESLRLPAGPYEVYYASYLDWNHDEHGDHSIGDIVRRVVDGIFDRNNWKNWGDWDDKFEDFEGDLRITVRTSARGRGSADKEALATDFLSRAFLTITSVPDDRYVVEGFMLKRPLEIDVYSIGEIIDDDRYDYAWIINAETRRKVWEMGRRNTAHAGGAWKNRMSRDRIRLDEGRYAVFYVSDGSHSAREWNAPPPYDPDFWGITLLTRNESDLRYVDRFDYENVPMANAIVTLRGLGDDQQRSAGFSLAGPTELRIYALGEGRDGRMFDYGWILDAETRRRVWVMDYHDTEHAGGARKNRLYDRVVKLDAGDYIAYFRTDDSHSYEDWNSDQPFDPAAWGITIVPANSSDASRISTFDAASRGNFLVELTQIRDDANVHADFTLDKDARVRIYAIGEGQGGEMYDCGWIENRDTGRVVWEMTYRMTEHAGGANKNRMVNTVIMLPAGNYRAHYKSDDSHSFEDWNMPPPHDPSFWGITVSLSRR